jgi:hypothetical protein
MRKRPENVSMSPVRSWVLALTPLFGPMPAGCEAVSELDEVAMARRDAAREARADRADVDDLDALRSTDVAADAVLPPADATVRPADSAVDAGLVADAGPFGFPESCVRPDAVVVQCDPRTNTGCPPGMACDLAENAGQVGFVCFPEGAVPAGGACDGVAGPYCRPTLHCGPGTCTRFCCTSADCAAPTPECGLYDPIRVGTFGWCI